ncbi:hypothetical protein OSTOST_21315 [Ostertagia ostertagi]
MLALALPTRNLSLRFQGSGVVLGCLVTLHPFPVQILYCIFVICCADLLVLCDLSLLVHFQISKQWIFGETICKVSEMFYCVEVLNKFLIPLALVHISRASYKSVSMQDNLKDRPRACMITANILAAATVLMLMVFVGYFSNTNAYWVRDKPMTVCNFNPPPYYETAFNLIAFVVGYIMTSVGYVYFYANVPILLKRRYSTNVTGDDGPDGHDSRMDASCNNTESEHIHRNHRLP